MKNFTRLILIICLVTTTTALISFKTPRSTMYEIKEITLSERYYIVKEGTVKFDEISTFLGTHLPAIYGALMENGIEPSAPPSAIYTRWDEATETAVMAAAIPVRPLGNRMAMPEGYKVIPLDETPAIHVAYYGAYEEIKVAHDAIQKYMEEKNLSLDRYVIEEYVTDPTTEEDSSKWLTNIYYLVKK